MAGRTLYKMFQETVAKYGDRPALSWKSGDAFATVTYKEWGEKSRSVARSLHALGIRRGDRIAILAENRHEWALADVAAQSLGVTFISIYQTLPAEQVEYIVKDSAARLLIASDKKQLAKVLSFRASTPALEQVVALHETSESAVLTWERFLRLGDEAAVSADTLDATAEAVEPDDIATFIYTSGTTGEPKGAMLSHRNLLQTPDAVKDEPVADIDETDVFLSWLPLSHISERIGGHYIPIRCGSCITYSQSLMTLKDELTTTVRPTAMISVPRLFENIYDTVKDTLAKADEKKRKMAEWAIGVGQVAAVKKSEGRSPGIVLSLQLKIADKVVLSKLREKVTGGRLKVCVSGGAPLDSETAKFFLGIGIQIIEGYGLSETSIIAINRPFRQRIGTVGVLMPNAEIKIADDGEILMRGQGLMKGYYNKPEATAEAIDTLGWFHTGDIGEISADGFIKITDRKKDLLVLANGKKVAPQPIEALLKHSPYIAEAVLLGDKQNTVSALIVPAFDKLRHWAKENQIEASDLAVLVKAPETKKLLKEEISKHSTGLADFERVKDFRVVDAPFGIETGELTPTLKVKRKFVAQKYAELIAQMSK